MLSQQATRDLTGIQQLAVREDYQRERVPALSGGMRTDKPPMDMELNESPALSNVFYFNNQIVPDTGYAVFGTTLTGTFFGTVQLTWQVFNIDGTASELLFTTKTVYVLDVTLEEWQLLNNNAGVFLSNNAQIVAGALSAVFASVAGVSVGQFIGLPLDNGHQLTATITGVNGGASSITWDTPIPAGRHVAATSQVVLAITLNGNLLNQIAVVPFPAKLWTVVSNNVDPIFYFDGSQLHALGGLPANTTCTWMVVFHEALFLLSTIENGTAFPQRVRMSDLGNPEAWTPGAGSSIAAIYDLLDTDDFIHSASLLGPYLIVYRETTIMRGTYLGLLNNTMFWEYMVFSEGLAAVGGLAEIGDEHEFVGNGNIYDYSGNYSLTGVGDAVFPALLSAVGELNSSAKDSIFTQYQQDYDEFWLLYPAGAATLPNKMLRRSLEKGGWFSRVFANTFVSASPYIPVEDTIWSSAVGTWASQQRAWNSRIFLANVASLAMCAPDTNAVYIYDYATTTDNGQPIAWSMETKDLSPGDQMFRWDSVRVYGAGNGVLCEHSTDSGQTWRTTGTLSFGVGRSLQVLTLAVTAPYLRFRLSGTDPAFVFNWLEAWFLIESEW